MKKLSKMFSMASAAAMMVSAIPAAAAAEDISYPKNIPDLEALVAEHPEGYIINDDGSIFLYPNNPEQAYFISDYCISSQKSYKTDRKDIGLVFTPEKENKGRYVVSLCSNKEDIIEFKLPENESGIDACHFHCFTPSLQTYLIDTTDGIKVEVLGIADMHMEEEIEAYVKKCQEEAAADPEKYACCFSKSFITMNELFDGIYVSYVNSKLTDDGNTAPFVMSCDGYNSFQRLIIGTPTEDKIFEMQPDMEVSVKYDGTVGASDDLRTRTGEKRFYRIYDLPEKEKQTPICITKDKTGIQYDFVPAKDGWSESIVLSEPVPYPPYEPVDPTDPTEPGQPAVPDDVNGDGESNVADLVTLNNYLMNGSGTIAAGADINGDGSVDSFDMVFLRKKLIKTETGQRNYTYIKDVTKYGTEKGITAAIMGESYVIHDFNELTQTISPLLREAVCRDLENRYSGGFFRNNDLLLCLTDNSGGEDAMTVKDIAFKLPNGDESSLHVILGSEETETDNEYIEIHQVALNKNVLGLGSGIADVVWDRNDRNNVENTTGFALLGDQKADITDKLVTSYDELASYFSGDSFGFSYDKRYYNSAADYIADEFKERCNMTLDEKFFETKSVYIHVTSTFEDDDYIRAETKDNVLRIHEKHIPYCGDIVFQLMKFYIFDNSEIEGTDTIELVSHRLIDERYDPGEDKAGNWDLGICQYSFNDESSVALYSRYRIGFAKNGYNLKNDVAVQAGFKPFGDDFAEVLHAAGDRKDISGENYSIKYGEENATVSFRTSPGGEFVSVDIPYDDEPYYY